MRILLIITMPVLMLRSQLLQPDHLSWLKSFQPNRQDSRDMTLFQDLDGVPGWSTVQIAIKQWILSRLSDDHLDVTGSYISIFRIRSGRHRPSCIPTVTATTWLLPDAADGEPNPSIWHCDQLIGPWKLIDNLAPVHHIVPPFDGQDLYFLCAESALCTAGSLAPDDLGLLCLQHASDSDIR